MVITMCWNVGIRLNRDALRAAAYATSSSSSSLHASSGHPVPPLQLPMYRSQPQTALDPTAPVTGLLGGQQPTSNLSGPAVYGVPVQMAYKRPAMLSSEYSQTSGRRVLFEPLKIDTELKKVLTEQYFRLCCQFFGVMVVSVCIFLLHAVHG